MKFNTRIDKLAEQLQKKNSINKLIKVVWNKETENHCIENDIPFIRLVPAK